MYRDRFINAW